MLDGKRRKVVRKTKEEIYDSLYEFYNTKEDR
jgi:hypothetical protein